MKKAEIDAIVISHSQGDIYKIKEINHKRKTSDDYIVMESLTGKAPWHCDKETWDKLLEKGDTTIKYHVNKIKAYDYQYMEDIVKGLKTAKSTEAKLLFKNTAEQVTELIEVCGKRAKYYKTLSDKQKTSKEMRSLEVIIDLYENTIDELMKIKEYI